MWSFLALHTAEAHLSELWQADVAAAAGGEVTDRLLLGDSLEVLGTLPDASIDACVTDPPYGIGFMGKEWDTFKPGSVKQPERFDSAIISDNPNLRGRRRSPAISESQIAYDYSLKGLRSFQAWTEAWAREVFRVLKPGAYIVACGAPRAYHRMASGLEDAGFEIRDCLAWLFGSGFPKSLNIGDGLGTALKPAHEPIVLARKPFKGTVKGNVERFGTGALNIDASRIPFASEDDKAAAAAAAAAQRAGHDQNSGRTCYGDFNDGPSSIARYLERMDLGRWPANVVIDDLAALVIDEQSGELTSGGGERQSDLGVGLRGNTFHRRTECTIEANSGGASRFYYVAKPSREERDFGTDGLTHRQRDDSRKAGHVGGDNPRNRGLQQRGNFHPTVKPVELMRWLVKLVTPINGTVLDPFLGSGTTGMACRYEQRGFIGIEREAEYLAIAERRIAAVAPLFAEALR